MKPLFITIFLFTASFGFAQKKIISVSYLKNDGKYVTMRDSADYFRLVTEPDSGSVFYNVAEYYKDSKRKLIGMSSTIDPPVFEEQCVRFYKNGNKQSITTYKKGLPVGHEYEFYTNGKPYLVKDYPDNSDPYNDINNNYLIIANYDSSGTVQVEDGNGYYKGYDSNFKYIYEEGTVKNGKRDSLWKGNYKNITTAFTESYKDGLLISGTATYEDGKSATYAKTRGVPPQFKGGLNAFSSYLGRSIEYPIDARSNNVQGKVILSFIVEKDGKISNIVVAKSVSPSIDAEAVRVIRNSPRWIPGTQFGRPVRVSYGVPISFNLSGN
jgi:TonB family protein